jgi:GNAT superfamily N-acetyltransferase
MTMPEPSLSATRPIAVADADAIAEMARDFTAYLQSLGDTVTYRLTAERVRIDGFGARPAFGGFIAEQDGAALGYLLHHEGYDSDRAERYLVVCDLFVREAGRRRGAGRALMTAAMGHCRAIGGCGLLWSVYKPNRMAAEFYRRIGARTIDDLDFMWWPIQA